MRRTEPKDELNIFREGVVRMKMCICQHTGENEF